MSFWIFGIFWNLGMFWDCLEVVIFLMFFFFLTFVVFGIERWCG